ncbi:MAG: hypothetical protein ACQKBV_09805, partial [Puniceicoccales bacterium]
MSNGPSLQSITIDPAGKPLRWRLLLPPNLPQCAPKDRIPVKLEAQLGNEVVPPERLSKTDAYWAEPPHLFAALLLESWNGGKLAGMLQLTRDQLSQVLQPLTNEDAVFSFRSPKQPMAWVDGQLPDVHPHLVAPKKAAPAPPSAAPKKKAPASFFREVEKDLAPMQVDGSMQYLAITLPSRESAVYEEALELVKHHGFKLEPSNRKWWLRDRHKTLLFLAENRERLRTHFRARFTDNFNQRTAKLKSVEARIHVREDGDDFIAEAELSAPGVDSEKIAQALTKGQPYIEGERGVFLLRSEERR